jgi:hypothetical protein
MRMRIPSGKVDQNIYFVGLDPTDLKTREIGLTSFTVYRSRNGAAEVAYTTPTVAEIDATNMPGVYALLIDEDTTIASTSDNEEYCVHITQASMAPVTRTFELYRRDTTSGQTIDVASGGVEVGSFQAGAITAAAIATGAIDADAIAADAVTEIQAGLATPTNITAGTITTVTNVTTVNGLAAGVITAASIATNAIDADAIAADAVTEIQSGLATAASISALNDLSSADVTAAVPTAAQIAAATVAEAVDGATTLAQSLALSNSALGGKLSGAGTGTETARDLADSKDRLVYTVDASGNRTAVTRTLT